MPNVPETVAAFLATASLGATWAAVAPEFGPQAVIDRFGQLEPSVLLTVDGYRYGDKDVDIRGRVADDPGGRCPTLQHTVSRRPTTARRSTTRSPGTRRRANVVS